MIKKILTWSAGLLVVVSIAIGITYLATQPIAPDATSESARWLEPGSHKTCEVDLTFTDATRPTASNGDFPGADSRTLNSTLWFPCNDTEPHPLVVYSHGFMSNRRGGEYMSRNLASHGYVVIAADYPLSSRGAPGGPQATDVVNQPADVSFLIDSIIALEPQQQPFQGGIDPTRIGVMGISLGGLTSTLAAFHPRLRDPRIHAAVSIAGPANMFTAAFFRSAQLPFLMIAGTVDAIVDYESNAAPIPERVADGALLTIAGGAHTSFVTLAEPMFRLMDNPDSLGCTAILASINEDSGDVFEGLGDKSDGVVRDQNAPALCHQNPLPLSIHPGRQQMMTQIAVLSFFQSAFASAASLRSEAHKMLEQGIANDFFEASFTR
jgi:predicted dienelactone hydrolase